MMKEIRIISLMITMFFMVSAHAVELPGPLVEAGWLAKNLGQVRVLDVRADVRSFTEKPVFVKDKKSGKEVLVRVGGHIDGASLVNYKKVRATRMIDGKKVTRMLPKKADFEKFMQSVGLGQDDTVVIVSEGVNDADMTMATRLYWQLKYFGQDKMAILNGGLAQWIIDGNPVSTTPGKVKPGNWKATAERNEILATSEDVANAVKNHDTQLIDTRTVGLYLGTWYKSSYVYAKGHIPGAKNFPNELITMPSAPARIPPGTEVKQLVSALGIKEDGKAITYCNSGHLASGSWFLMSEVLGNKNVKLYDGSMHEWTLEKRPTTVMKME